MYVITPEWRRPKTWLAFSFSFSLFLAPSWEEDSEVKRRIGSNLFFIVWDVKRTGLNSVVAGDVNGPSLAQWKQEVRS